MLSVHTKHHSNYYKKNFASLIICTSLIFLVACASTADKMDRLNSTLRGYEKALRWAKFDIVYSYHKWDSAEQPAIPKHLKNIRITNYSASNNSFNEKDMTAKQTVTMSFYNKNNLIEHSLDDKQRWKYFPDEKRWYLMSKPPSFQ